MWQLRAARNREEAARPVRPGPENRHLCALFVKVAAEPNQAPGEETQVPTFIRNVEEYPSIFNVPPKCMENIQNQSLRISPGNRWTVSKDPQNTQVPV